MRARQETGSSLVIEAGKQRSMHGWRTQFSCCYPAPTSPVVASSGPPARKVESDRSEVHRCHGLSPEFRVPSLISPASVPMQVRGGFPPGHLPDPSPQVFQAAFGGNNERDPPVKHLHQVILAEEPPIYDSGVVGDPVGCEFGEGGDIGDAARVEILHHRDAKIRVHDQGEVDPGQSQTVPAATGAAPGWVVPLLAVRSGWR